MKQNSQNGKAKPILHELTNKFNRTESGMSVKIAGRGIFSTCGKFLGGLFYRKESHSESTYFKEKYKFGTEKLKQGCRKHVMPFVGENFLFLQESAKPHISKVVLGCLNEVNILGMDRTHRN